jgi:hypothetical protein
MTSKGTMFGFVAAAALALAALPTVGAQSEAERVLSNMMDTMNVQLAAGGAGYRVGIADYVTAGDGGVFGGTVLAKSVGNKQLSADFVARDERRDGWSGAPTSSFDDITWAVDQTGDAVPILGGLTTAETTAAITSAVTTWSNVNCSTLPLTFNFDFGVDIGLVAFLNGLGASPFVVADIQHAGFRDINFTGGIIGVTFTFIFVDGPNPTDVDGNGKADTAFSEIYFDPSFPWRDDGSDIDLETVALHEFGHGLSQAHFGTVWLKNDGSLKASPRAVMNALYAGPLRTPQGTDNGGHCSNWANWPNH